MDAHSLLLSMPTLASVSGMPSWHFFMFALGCDGGSNSLLLRTRFFFVMPVPGYAEIKDSEGNAIEGSVQVAGREGMCEVMKFDHNVRIPTDQQSGDLTGVRQHQPAMLVKPYDKASPLLFDALCNGETLKEVKIHWYKIDKTGSEVEYFTHTLEEAKIADMQSFMPNTKDPAKEQFTHMERVSILYGKITWLYQDGNIEYTDSWTAER